MAPKRKKGGKKGKKDKNPKENDNMTAVDKTFYELTIIDLNSKLARLRSHVAKLENSQEEMNEQMRQLEEDRTDITAYLQRQLTEKIHIIRDMDEKISELEKIREEENKINREEIKNWETKYKAMHEQLTSEIKLLNGKLNSLEEFRLQRADLLMKFDEQEAEMKEQRRIQREKIHEMEQKGIIEKDKLKKDIQLKLLELSDEFTKSSEIRIAGYTRRLIKENIALNKEMDRIVLSQIRMIGENRKMKGRFIDIESSYASSITVKERLITTCQNQIEIIQNLTEQYEALQSKYHKFIHYKELYETMVKREICDTFSFNDMAKKLRIMAQRIEKLKGDKQKLISMHQDHETEILQLINILKQIKFSVQYAIHHDLDDSNEPEFQASQRKNLLTEIMKILTTYSDKIITKQSKSAMFDIGGIYRPGLIGLTPKAKMSLLELFKRKAKKIASTEYYLPAFKMKPFDSRITPQEHVLQNETLLDVKIGSTIIFCTGREKEALQEDDLENKEDVDRPSSAAISNIFVSESKQKKEKMKETVQGERKIEKERIVSEEVEDEEQGAETSSLDKDTLKISSIFKDSNVEAESAAIFEAMTEADEEEDEVGYFF